MHELKNNRTHALQTPCCPPPGRWCSSPGPAARPPPRSSSAASRSRSTRWRPWCPSPPDTGSPHDSSHLSPASRGSTPPARPISADSRSDIRAAGSSAGAPSRRAEPAGGAQSVPASCGGFSSGSVRVRGSSFGGNLLTGASGAEVV